MILKSSQNKWKRSSITRILLLLKVFFLSLLLRKTIPPDTFLGHHKILILKCSHQPTDRQPRALLWLPLADRQPAVVCGEVTPADVPTPLPLPRPGEWVGVLIAFHHCTGKYHANKYAEITTLLIEPMPSLRFFPQHVFYGFQRSCVSKVCSCSNLVLTWQNTIICVHESFMV